MTTQIKSVAQANKQFESKLKLAAGNVDQSHKALVWALLHAIEEQDVSQLDTMLGVVVEYWPTLVSRFTDYVVATLDGVTFEQGAFNDNGIQFALSQCAVLATPWNTRERLKKDAKPAKAYDVRTDIKRALNKVAKCAANKLHTTSTLKGTSNQAIADILKKAQADIEAVYAGQHVERVNAVDNSDVANVTAIGGRKRKAA
tara:strand:- start:1095 stop:1697 length:603 start_codon:yes stop_codon:yes gene_type:complete